jgi:hypothetical protein
MEFLYPIRFFYHFALMTVALMGFFMIIGLWRNRGQSWDYYGKGMVFSALVVLSWSMASIGHFLIEIFGLESQAAVFTSSIFRFLSMCNNLFIFLLLPYLGLFRKWRTDKFNFQVTLIALVFFMFVFLIDKIRIGENQLGAMIVVWLDVLMAVPIIFLLGKGLTITFDRLYPQVSVFKLFIALSVLVLLFLNLFSLAVPLFDLRNSVWVAENVYITYFIQLPVLFFLVMAMIIVAYRMQNESTELERRVDPVEGKMTALSKPEVVFQESEPQEYLPLSLHMGFKPEVQQFCMSLVCKREEESREFHWQGPNCTYPFFYWIYLYVAGKMGVAVQMKDGQVNRNRMVALFDKQLNPRLFVNLMGNIAELNFDLRHVKVDPHVFKQAAFKLKFKEQIEPFFQLTEVDAKLFYKDWVYAEKKFEEIYAKVLEALAV